MMLLLRIYGREGLSVWREMGLFGVRDDHPDGRIPFST